MKQMTDISSSMLSEIIFIRYLLNCSGSVTDLLTEHGVVIPYNPKGKLRVRINELIIYILIYKYINNKYISYILLSITYPTPCPKDTSLPIRNNIV